MGRPALYGYVESCFSLFSPFFQKIIFDLGFGWQNHFFVNGFAETFYGYFYYPSLKRLARGRVENRASL